MTEVVKNQQQNAKKKADALKTKTAMTKHSVALKQKVSGAKVKAQ